MPIVPTIQELNRRILSHMDDHGLRAIVIYLSDTRNDPALRYDNLGDSFGDRAINLIQYCRDNRCMSQLIDLLKSNNPVVLSVQQPPPDPIWDEWAQQRDSAFSKVDPSAPAPTLTDSPASPPASSALPTSSAAGLPEGITLIELQQAAAVVNQLGVYGEAADLHSRALALTKQGRFGEALGYYQQAISASERAGDLSAKRHALADLATAYVLMNQYAQALAPYQQAFSISMQLGDARAAGTAMTALGNTYAALGQPQQAVASFEQAITLFTQMGDLPSAATVWNSMGAAYTAVGMQQQASYCYMQATMIRQSMGIWQ
jgi:tetratricopeptide (TPR) repeat protein